MFAPTWTSSTGLGWINTPGLSEGVGEGEGGLPSLLPSSTRSSSMPETSTLRLWITNRRMEKRQPRSEAPKLSWSAKKDTSCTCQRCVKLGVPNVAQKRPGYHQPEKLKKVWSPSYPLSGVTNSSLLFTQRQVPTFDLEHSVSESSRNC